jgi:transcriptional regulator with XRE-family HTH domain
MSPSVTVGQAFRETLKRLLEVRNLSQTELAERAGLDISTVSRLLGGSRGQKGFTSLEKIRRVFNLTPADLFDVDRALARLGLARTVSESDGPDTWTSDQAAKAHTLVTEASHGIGSGSPSAHEGGVPAMYERADPELYQAMTALWDRLDLKAHVRLVELGQELRNAAGATTAAKRLG